jgi:hypothetical protein
MLHIKKINENLKGSNIIKNPFMGFIKTFNVEDQTLIIIKMQPLYFNFPIFLLLGGIGSGLVFGLLWFTTLPICMGSLSIFWSPIFFRTMFNLSLRKIEPKPEITYIKQSEALEILSIHKRGD